MKSNRIYAVWAVFLLGVLGMQVSAQRGNYYFRCLNTENGLSQNSVLSILQDRTGFMWFGTKDGLNKYDGSSVKVYKQREGVPHSLGNNTVWSLLELPDGTIWAGTDCGIYVYDPVTDRFEFFSRQTERGRAITGSVLDMKLDRQGNVWIACRDLYRYSIHTGKLETALPMPEARSGGVSQNPRVWSVNVDNDGQVWISLFNGGLKKFNPKTDTFDVYTKDEDGNDLMKGRISGTVNVGNDFLFIGSCNDRLKILDKTTGRINAYLPGNVLGASDLYVRTMACFSDRNVWLGTESGLYIHNPVTKKTRHLTHNINDRYSLSDNVIYSMYEDREGGVWIGTYFGGVNYYPMPYTHFQNYYPVPGQNSLSGERVSGLCEDGRGYLWIGTEDAGLNRLDLETANFEHIASGNGLNYHNVHDIIRVDDELWIATFSQGVNVLDLNTGAWRYYQAGDREGMLNNNDIFALYRDSAHRIWVGTSTGLFLYDRAGDCFDFQEYLGDNFISDMMEDDAGRMWIATYSRGVFCYNLRTKELRNYTYDPSDPSSMCYHKITCMYMDGKKRLWFGSESNGICMYDEERDCFVRYGMKDGFSNNAIYKILDDNSGNLWLSSNSGLMRFNPDTRQIRVFTRNNGLPSNQFNYKSGYKDKNGKLYFGSLNGLVAFLPDDFMQNDHVPPVVITELRLLNSDCSFSGSLCDSGILSLEHDQSSLSIDFASLSYVAPEMNRYAYKMEGLEDDWNYLATPQKIIYSNLPHGRYVFRVKATNNDGVWNEAGDVLEIVIRPPFWQTPWAYLLYGVAVLLTVWVVFYYYARQMKGENSRRTAIFEREKEKEMYNSKIDFFTNIAHEIRTPLTLIKAPLEYIIGNDVKKEDLKSNLLVMEKNTDRLLSLINQLLDFRKTESKGFSLAFTKENVNVLLQETYVRFAPLARQRGLMFDLSLPDETISADIDREAVTKVVSNLFTNAIKYAHSRIQIDLTADTDRLRLSVRNDGELIPEEIKEKIFEPFFQAKEGMNGVKSGSGIGLALVRSLVELHEGSVFLDTEDRLMNTFVVILPRKQERVFEMEEPHVEQKPVGPDTVVAQDSPLDQKDSLLLVDDNEELLQFLVERLKRQYVIFQAKNGVEALAMLEKEVIGLIVSDIMMPQMNGFELCAKVKNNPEFSHIPVILLTAKTNIQSKVEGLECGADAYIEKPFSMEYLSAQISNLLSNRRKIREAFANSPLVHAGTIALNKADEQFLKKLTDMVLMNISNSDFKFNVDHLAEELCMSRSSLLRKIKGITGATPNDFIRLIRLKKAAEILQEGEYKINEVCYLVGFSSTSYFTKAFQKQFGVLPRDFVKSLRKKEE